MTFDSCAPSHSRLHKTYGSFITRTSLAPPFQSGLLFRHITILTLTHTDYFVHCGVAHRWTRTVRPLLAYTAFPLCGHLIFISQIRFLFLFLFFFGQWVQLMSRYWAQYFLKSFFTCKLFIYFIWPRCILVEACGTFRLLGCCPRVFIVAYRLLVVKCET